MTTAHRPTWAPAKGHEEEGSNRLYFKSAARSAKDIAGFTKLKMRQVGQSTQGELSARDLRAELEAKEKTHFDKKRNFEGPSLSHSPILLQAPLAHQHHLTSLYINLPFLLSHTRR